MAKRWMTRREIEILLTESLVIAKVILDLRVRLREIEEKLEGVSEEPQP